MPHCSIVLPSSAPTPSWIAKLPLSEVPSKSVALALLLGSSHCERQFEIPAGPLPPPSLDTYMHATLAMIERGEMDPSIEAFLVSHSLKGSFWRPFANPGCPSARAVQPTAALDRPSPAGLETRTRTRARRAEPPRHAHPRPPVS